jgi:hypothetical protein
LVLYLALFDVNAAGSETTHKLSAPLPAPTAIEAPVGMIFAAISIPKATSGLDNAAGQSK